MKRRSGGIPCFRKPKRIYRLSPAPEDRKKFAGLRRLVRIAGKPFADAPSARRRRALLVSGEGNACAPPGARISLRGMERSIITLSGRREAPFFKEFLLARNPRLKIFAVHDREDLASAIDRTGGAARLIAFVTDVIVPTRLLTRLNFTPYNIHPGPPEYPGSHPESFAIWEMAETFGVTAHEMTPRVDDGPIVAVCRFPMPLLPERVALADLTYARAIEVFAVVAAHCAESNEPMPRMNIQWSGVKRTRSQFRALCGAASDMTGNEAERLKRACGNAMTRQHIADVL